MGEMTPPPAAAITAATRAVTRAAVTTVSAPLAVSRRQAGAPTPPAPVARAEERDDAPKDAPGELDRALAARLVLNQALTVDGAVLIALRESPVVRGAQAELDAAQARLGGARAERRPMLSANTFLSGGSMANIVESPPLPVARMIMGLPRGGFVDQNLMLMYPLSTGGRLGARVREASSLRGAAAEDLEAQRQEVALLVRIAYREVQARQALVEVARARLREDEERLRLDRARLEQERVPAYFVKRDEAEVAVARQELTNAQRDALLSLSQLKTLMGVDLASRLELSEPLEYLPAADLIARLAAGDNAAVAPPPSASPPSAPPAPGGVDTVPAPAELSPLLRRAETTRPELRAAGRRVQGAQAGEAATRAGYRPQVNLFAMGDIVKARGERAMGGVTYGLAASIPLYTGGGDRARSGEAAAERRRAEAERERLALQVAKEVNDAYLSLGAAEQNVRTARAALDAAHEEYRAARARYDAGRSVLVEVLDALAARTRAESDVVQALFQHSVARDQLARAVGASPATKPSDVRQSMECHLPGPALY